MKRRNKIITLLISTITVVTLLSTATAHASADGRIRNLPKSNATYEFDVIGDTHITDRDEEKDGNQSAKRLRQTLRSIAETYGSNSQCIVINGDAVDNCNSSCYAKLSSIIYGESDDEHMQFENKNMEDGPVNSLPYIYFNIGNHEFNCLSSGYDIKSKNYGYCLDLFNRATSSIQNNVVTAKRWITTTPRTGSYDLQYINGKNSRLAFLGTDWIVSNNSSNCSGGAELGSNQLNWFGQLIRDNSYEGAVNGKKKPMFAFLHQPLDNTTFGTYGYTSKGNLRIGWGILDQGQSAYVKRMLEGHPEMITFTSHEHYPFGPYGPSTALYQYSKNGCQILATPCIMKDGSSEDEGIYPTENPQGYHVRVYEDSNRIEVDCVEYYNSGSRDRVKVLYTFNYNY